MAIKIKANEQYFPKILLIILYKVVSKFVDEVLECEHSSESYQAILSGGTVYYVAQGGFNF